MSSTKPRPPRRVALFIESSRAAGSHLLLGVARYARENTGWSVYFEPRDLDYLPPRWLRGWHGDGILARISSRQQALAFQATGLPVIDLRGAVADQPFPTVLADNRFITQLAFGHLRGCGLTHFAYCGLTPGH